MCVADASTRVIATNAAFDARVGPCRNRSIPSLFVDPGERARAAAQLERILADGSSAVIRGACATSELRLVLSWSCRVVNDSILAVVENITDQRLEDELGRTRPAEVSDEGRHRAASENSLGPLAGGIAHDFNNLLTVILGQLQFLRRSRTMSETDRGHADEAFAAANHAVALTRQLVALGRGQALQATQPRVFSVNAALSSMADMLRDTLGDRIALSLSLDEAAPLIETDPNQLEQVVLTLVRTARDAMPGGGKLLVGSQATWIDEVDAAEREGARVGAHVAVIVADTGCGMSPEALAHLLQPSLGPGSREERGGVDLATTRGIVRQSGGHIVVRSTPGSGSTFELYFPCIPERPNRVIAQSFPRPDPIESGTRRETVLVVEDEDGLRRLVADILERAGYRVLSAANGEEAIRALLEDGGSIDLLLTDFVMPRMNGHALAARVESVCPRVRVLLMSGCDDTRGPESTERPIPVLEKPFVEETLLRKIREALRTE